MLNEKIVFILQQAAQSGVSVFLNEGKLSVRKIKGTGIDAELVKSIQENKDGIKKYLKNLSEKKEQRNVTIPVATKAGSLVPLSFAQERLWLIDKIHGSLPYNLHWSFKIDGNLNIEALNLAFEQVIDRHHILRTVIRETEGSVYQFILPPDHWKINYSSIEEIIFQGETIDSFFRNQYERPFDLNNDWMLKVFLVKKAEKCYQLLLVVHHIVFDGWSVQIMIRDLMKLYDFYCKDSPIVLPALKLQYSDFAIWQRNAFESGSFFRQLEYWKNKLAGFSSLSLNTDYARPLFQGSKGDTIIHFLDHQLTESLMILSRQKEVSFFMTLISVFKILLNKYTGQNDICLGIPIAGRQSTESEALIGFFVNTLVLRNEIHDDDSFYDFLMKVKATTLEAYDNQDIPFEKILENLNFKRDTSKHPVFQIMLVMQDGPSLSPLSLGETVLQLEDIKNTTSRFDIELTIIEHSDGINIVWNYCTDLFKQETIERMACHFDQLLKRVSQNPDQKIAKLELISPLEKEQILGEFNDQDLSLINDKNLVDLFSIQALMSPAVNALKFKEDELTYGELDKLSNKLGHYLKGLGVGPECLVPIVLDRSFEMIIAILGVLKAGGAYVPIDPEYPLERIQYILKDTAAEIIVCSRTTEPRLAGSTGIIKVELDGAMKDVIKSHSSDKVDVVISPDNLAYIIYTSGSTGRPKGVLIQHLNVVSLFKSSPALYDFNSGDVWTMFHSFCFDFSVWEMFGALLHGGCLVLVPKDIVKDSKLFAELLRNEKVTVLNQTPSSFYILQESFTEDLSISLRYIIFGGEYLSLAKLKPFTGWKSNCQFINMYGITETTVHVTFYPIKTDRLSSDNRNIGKPIPSLNIHLLDSHLQLQPIGIAGEIYVGGAGLARGYLNRPELTADRFINNPFQKGNRLYRTGDLGRWLPDGTIEFLGRIDDQIKIRGYRIEAGEIEHVMQESGLVKQSLVVARDDSSGISKHLAAYVVVAEGYNKEALQHYMLTHLPEFMVPALFMEMESLPLTSNGKIDKKNLPEIDTAKLFFDTYQAPGNKLEFSLVRIWQELLGLSQIGIYDNFFEIGGHSLLATRVVSAIRAELQLEIGIKELFQYATIAELSAHLEGQTGLSLLPPISLQPRPKYIPLSFAQERLWFIDGLQGSVQYHMPWVFNVKGNLDQKYLESSFRELILRHEILRTVILEKDGIGYQDIRSADNWEMSFHDLSDPEMQELGPERWTALQIQKPFDLSSDYMLRVQLITVSPDEYTIVLVLHHIASDGWSMSILVKEVLQMYSAFVRKAETGLAELPLQYADYAIWQRRYLDGEVLEKQLNYWKNKLKDVPQLYLPSDYPRPLVQSTTGNTIYFNLEKSLSESLQVFSQQEGATLFMTMLSVFKILLYRYTGQTDLCVGIAIAGRTQKEIESSIGFFVNSLPIRSNIDKELQFRDFLSQVRSTMVEGYTYQDAPFEKVIEAVVDKRETIGNSLFQLMFILQNTPEIPEIELEGVTLTDEFLENDTSKFDITFDIREKANGIEIRIVYCSDLFMQETIERMAHCYEQLLRSVILNPESCPDDLEMLSMPERNQLLDEFNNTFVDYQIDNTLVDMFSLQAKRTPGAVALVYQDIELTYKELAERSNQLSNYLKHLGVRSESLVPICIDRSPEMIISILGVLKAGGAYVPIDPYYPQERINYMLEDTGATVAICKAEQSSLLVNRTRLLDIVEIDKMWSMIANYSKDDSNFNLSPKNLMYVIYTSGSTGKPKGVLMEHGSLVNFVIHQSRLFDIKKDDRILQFYSFCFDPSVEQIFLPLINGAVCVLIPDEIRKDLNAFESFLRTKRITHLQATPSFLTTVRPGSYGNLRRVIAGGEICSLEMATKWNEHCDFFNKYGPTETGITATEYKFTKNNVKLGIVPIGAPVSNTFIYILNSSQGPVPLGVAGEIYIGGIQVARGYLNRSELTAEKFIPNPFKSDGRLYRTGDLGRWLKDGTIEFLGRVDDQIKIRGYRIEPGEIEYVVNQLEMISVACVIARSDAFNFNKLVCYYVPEKSITQLYERQLSDKRVESWRELNEKEYSETEKIKIADEEFNITGWNDSFTGAAIPDQEMKEWLDDITNVIMAEKPENVIEIGCGTGLIFYRLANRVKKYTGTDLSASGIRQIMKRISLGEREYGNSFFTVGAAHELLPDNYGETDTIILNSVTQYFPSEHYLSEVLKNCIELLDGRGRIIIGDIRDIRMLFLFKARLLLNKFDENVSLEDFLWSTDQEVLREEELCLSPEYFYQLQLKYPDIRHIDIQWKQGNYINELSSYRYTVVIHLNIEKDWITPDWKIWEHLSLNDTYSLLKAEDDVIAIRNIPNFRTSPEFLLKHALINSSMETVGDLKACISQGHQENVAVIEFMSLASSLGYQFKFLVGEDPFKFDLVISKAYLDKFIDTNHKPVSTANQISNTPLTSEINSKLLKIIRTQLQLVLPEYMMPSEIVNINQMPLNSNGKIDRKLLKNLKDIDNTNKATFASPRNELEFSLAGIWQELLRLSQIGIYDNFFEIGGHSLLATRVVSAIRAELQLEIGIKELFQYATIAELSAHLEGQTGLSLLPPISLQPRPKYIPLSFAQERLWFIDGLQGSVQYHMPWVFNVKGNLDQKYLESSFRELILRHEILRTVILEKDGIGYQEIRSADNWEMSFHDLSDPEMQELGPERWTALQIQKPFDLSSDYMFRVQLITVSPDEYTIVLVLHHIASDGWSMSILVKEVLQMYSAFVRKAETGLAELPLQYADYAIWQRRYLNGEVLEKQLNYWKNKLKDVPPLYLPSDYPRPLVQSTTGNTIYFHLEKPLSESLQELSQQEGATLFMTMLSVFKILLYRYTGQTDLCVGIAIAGRTQKEIESSIGFFVNSLPIRSNIDKELQFRDFLFQVRSTMVEGYTYQDAPFEKVIEAVIDKRQTIGNSLFQLMFVLQNTPEIPEIEFKDIIIKEQLQENTTSKFDITFDLRQKADGLEFRVEYCSELFTGETIERMFAHYKQLLTLVAKDASVPIRLLKLLSSEDQNKLLEEMNSTI